MRRRGGADGAAGLGSHFPKSDFANTIAAELIASVRVKDTFVSNGITGVSFEPVYQGKQMKPSDKWFQMLFHSTSASVVYPTEAGASIFDPDETGRYRCPKGHHLGLNIISELYVERRSIGEHDLVQSQQFVGPHNTSAGGDGGSVLRPRRFLLASRRVYELVRAAGLKGWKFEIVRMVDDGRAKST